jgi:hypothetical protein
MPRFEEFSEGWEKGVETPGVSRPNFACYPELYFPAAKQILDFYYPAGQGLSQPIASEQPLQTPGIGPGSIFLDLFLAEMIIEPLPGF